ncbi:tripartite ATP-independent transporter solute receptor, DctP family [Alteribacillus persepolensis]|uniref:Tripartite ATP-independent transporter solute receptor, DctP family n=1 Tax=Alteribacillus persepolensis TaxID=568899 RepID=A0A1G8B233_9BACI|nr:TRAP transporter substrate-binding protein [Alteribacillus persepolensis]SDH27319.1 tripartite ATP-independent transporter solute receptor, DctP family [Alteribacillus persepolensis]
MNFLRNIMVAMTGILGVSVLVAFISGGEAFQSDDEIVLRFGHGAAESNERHLAVMHFKELVEERTNGKINVQVYPNEQLGSEAEMIESVTLNDLQMAASSAFSQYDQRISVFELPYLFDSYEEAWEILDGELGQAIAEPLLEDNLRVLAYFENGFRHVTSNKPIEAPEDLRGLKIRTPEFPLSLSTFQALGANPTPMAFGELYMALQQGTVDAQENPVANIYASKFQEVQKYLNVTGHQYIPLPTAINEDFWQSLSPDLQRIVQESAQEAAQYHRDMIVENEEKMMEELQEAGMEMIEPDKEPFRKETEQVHEIFRRQQNDETVNQLLDQIKE